MLALLPYLMTLIDPQALEKINSLKQEHDTFVQTHSMGLRWIENLAKYRPKTESEGEEP